MSGGDERIKRLIWEMIGYLLVPDMTAKAFFVLQGVGDSGKSVLGNLISSLFNPESVSHMEIFRFRDRFATNGLKNKRLLDKLMGERLAVGEAWSNPDNLVFTNELGEHIKHDVIYRHLKRIFAQMGVPDMRFHDLRHSYAVLSLQSGRDIKTVQENLGHYAAAFTLDTYGHVTKHMRRESADKINQLVDRLKAQ